MAVLTGPVVVTATEAAQLNEAFLAWFDKVRPTADPVARIRAVREANWQATPVADFENHLARLQDWAAAL